MPHTLSNTSEWSVGSMCLLPLTVADVGAMAITVAAGGAAPWPVIGSAAAAGLAVVLLVVRAQMPAGAKVAQVGAVIAMLLLLAASQDKFGLRGVDRAMAKARVAAAPAVGTVAAPAGDDSSIRRATVEIRSDGTDPDGVAAALSTALVDVLPPDAPHVSGRIAVEELAGRRATAMTWSLERGGTSTWCGTLRVTGSRPDVVVERFRDAIVSAALASRGSTLACF